ncbi:MAG: YnbE family lipoprotein [Alphaproteobacteria bacterium]|nr:YnbE family lipoprotein [Alphaproteobacteria bacterium]MCB9928579.1 YnbE family lipoprotein [Alphaproteobacteria bacterium]
MDRRRLSIAVTLAAGLALAGCQPSVQLKAPDKPIVINLNIKIEREVRVKIEREVEDLMRERKDLF